MKTILYSVFVLACCAGVCSCNKTPKPQATAPTQTGDCNMKDCNCSSDCQCSDQCPCNCSP